MIPVASSKRVGRGLKNHGTPPGRTPDRGLGASSFAARPVCPHERMLVVAVLGAHPPLREAVEALSAAQLAIVDSLAVTLREDRRRRRHLTGSGRWHRERQ